MDERFSKNEFESGVGRNASGRIRFFCGLTVPVATHLQLIVALGGSLLVFPASIIMTLGKRDDQVR